MPTRGQKVRVGIFILFSLSLFLILIAIVTRQKFLQKQDLYYIAYENVSVSGLEIGSPVKYLGIKIGVVEDITIDPTNVNRVIVKVSVKEGTPIKADATALIASVGITGLKTIEIRGGTQEARTLEPGEFIPAGTSITEEITGRAEIITEKLEAILNNLYEFTRPEKLNKITQFAEQSTRTFEEIEEIISENREQLKLTLDQT
ncbi:MAG: MCE family protein, partial [Calditrichaeota bacterium]